MKIITQLWTDFLNYEKRISRARIERLYQQATVRSRESHDGELCSTLDFSDDCTVEELMLVAKHCQALGNHVRVFHEIGWDEYSDEMKAYFLSIEFRAEPFPQLWLSSIWRRLAGSSYYVAV